MYLDRLTKVLSQRPITAADDEEDLFGSDPRLAPKKKGIKNKKKKKPTPVEPNKPEEPTTPAPEVKTEPETEQVDEPKQEEEAPKEEKPTEEQQSSKENILKDIKTPQLLLIKLDAFDDYSELKKFLKAEFDTSVNLTESDEVHTWVVDTAKGKVIGDQLEQLGITHKLFPLPEDLLKKKEPFTDIKFELPGVDEGKLKSDLQVAWAKVAPNSQLQKEPTEAPQQNKQGNLERLQKMSSPSLFLVSTKEGSEWEESGSEFIDDMKEHEDKVIILHSEDGGVLAIIGDTPVIQEFNDQAKFYQLDSGDVPFDKDLWTKEKGIAEDPIAGMQIVLEGHSPKSLRNLLRTSWKEMWKDYKHVEEKKDDEGGDTKEETSIFSRIEKLKEPIFLVVTVPEKEKAAYDKILSDLGAALNPYVNLANTDTLKGWVIENGDSTGFRKKLDQVSGIGMEEHKFKEEKKTPALSHVIVAADLIKGKDLVAHGDPFADMPIPDDLKKELQSAWGKAKGDEPKGDSEEGEELTKQQTSIQLDKIRRLKNPYILILNPIGDTSNYKKALSDKSPLVPELNKCIHFHESNIFKDGNLGVDLFFLDKSQVSRVEGKLKGAVQYSLMPAKEGFHEDNQPFKGMTVNDATLKRKIQDLPKYINELNQIWSHHDEDSGQKIPAVEIGNRIPLDYLRFLNKKQRPVKMYIGDWPAGSGSVDSIYALADKQETDMFLKRIKALNMPSLFYRGIFETSDIDAGFKKIDPESFTPANALILDAVDTFDPQEIVQPDEDNQELYKAAAKGFSSKELDELNGKIEDLEKVAERARLTDKWPTGMDEKKYQEQIKNLNLELDKEASKSKVTQLHMLHAYAKTVLGSMTKKTGTFLNGKYTIGTHVANFSKDMKRCILWGSLSKHVTIDKAEILKQMPFIKKVNTDYL